MDSMRKW